jgi:hypothetical protein
VIAWNAANSVVLPILCRLHWGVVRTAGIIKSLTTLAARVASTGDKISNGATSRPTPSDITHQR